MDVWFWIAMSCLVLVIPFLAIRQAAARNRVDPTTVSIDAATAARVRELYAKGDNGRLQAIKELRTSTGLDAADAARVVDKLGAPKRR